MFYDLQMFEVRKWKDQILNFKHIYLGQIVLIFCRLDCF